MECKTISLSEQFQSLQKQQKQRYRTRKALKSGDENATEAVSPNKAHHYAEDDLQLWTTTQESETCSATKNDLSVATNDRSDGKEIDFLREQVEHLQLEISQLRAALKQKEQELTRVQKSREEERLALGGASSTATQRIVELSRKNRELSAEITAEKSRVRQLQKKLKEAENAHQAQAQSAPSNEGTHQKTSIVAIPAVVEPSITVQLQEELQQTRQKVAEHRNQCQLLKQDLKLTRKVLAKEVGEGVSVSALLSGVSGWRGRAQQIISLQNRVSELKQQLERVQEEKQVASSTDVVSGVSNGSGSRVNVRQKATLQKMESERRKNLEETRLQLDGLRSEYARVQQQYSALKARNKTLTADVKSLKSQLTTLLEKTTQDREQILALMRSKSTSATSSESENTDGRQWEEERKHLHHANQQLQTQLAMCLSELQSLKETRIQNSTAPSQENGSRVHSGSRTSLPPLIPRPPSSRQNSARTLVRKSVSAGETCSNRQLSCDLSEAQTLGQVAGVERDRLMELTTSLQQRLDATTDRLVRLETELRNQRQQSVKLEKQLSRFHITSSSSSKQRTKEHVGENGGTVSELESQLALQRDENAVLRETLELTRHEKLEDIRLFHSMLQEAKQLFVESIRRLREQGSSRPARVNCT